MKTPFMLSKILLCVTPALGLGLLTPTAHAQFGPGETPAAAQTVTIGRLKVVALTDAIATFPNDGMIFGGDAGPAAVADALKAAGLPGDRISLSVGGLLVKDGKRLVLIDTGLGPTAHGGLVNSLAQAGVSPAQITDVLITHSHPDHVGGLVDAAGRLTYANATIRMAAAEWDWLQANTQLATLVTAIAPKVQTFAPGAMVAPGIRAAALPGHTPGHMSYRIVSGKASLVDIGDMAHSPAISLGHPEWTMGYDSDQPTAKATRGREFAKLAATRQLIFAPHFPFPGIGRIVKAEQGYQFAPALK